MIKNFYARQTEEIDNHIKKGYTPFAVTFQGLSGQVWLYKPIKDDPAEALEEKWKREGVETITSNWGGFN